MKGQAKDLWFAECPRCGRRLFYHSPGTEPQGDACPNCGEGLAWYCADEAPAPRRSFRDLSVAKGASAADLDQRDRLGAIAPPGGKTGGLGA